LDHLHSGLETLVARIRSGQLTNNVLRLHLFDVAAPQYRRAITLQRGYKRGLRLRPQADDRHLALAELQLICGPRTDLRRDVAVTVFPQASPHALDQGGDLILAVQFLEHEEGCPCGFVEQKRSTFVRQIVLVLLERKGDALRHLTLHGESAEHEHREDDRQLAHFWDLRWEQRKSSELSSQKIEDLHEAGVRIACERLR